MSKDRRVHRSVLVGTATIGLLAGSTLFAGGAGAELPEGAEFGFTGAAAEYVVPTGVCQVEIVAAGAQGGMNDYGEESEGGSSQLGGLGGVATSVITVTPGETLQVNVGGRGGDGSSEVGGGAGGWNGGGAGGGLGYDPQHERSGKGAGGGGGASDVRQGGTDLDDRVVVGGGGGGVGTFTDIDDAPYGVPGVGGNPATAGTDEYEFDPAYPNQSPATGGGAGTDSAGGPGGTGGHYSGEGTWDGADGADGTLGLGGNGGTDPDFGYGGGGGGAGLYGGGGGAIGGEELDTAGGGGSSLGDTSTPGTNQGDGGVTITPVAECESPNSTVPDSTVPDSTVPDSTVPASTVPDTTVPDSTVPASTVPETTVPDSTLPDPTVPVTTLPSTTTTVAPSAAPVTQAAQAVAATPAYTG